MSGINWHAGIPYGLAFGLKHSTAQSSKKFMWDGGYYDPKDVWQGSQSQPMFQDIRLLFQAQNGGDMGGSAGQGYYWFEAVDFRLLPPTFVGDWSALQSVPPGLVVGLKHSSNQPNKKFFSGGQTYDPIASWRGISAPPQGFRAQHGGDLGGSRGEGFYWYESLGANFADWNAPLPPGLVFGLKHSRNQPNKIFTWNGATYDPVAAIQRGGGVPPGFKAYHGGDLSGSTGEGYYWFETVGAGF